MKPKPLNHKLLSAFPIIGVLLVVIAIVAGIYDMNPLGCLFTAGIGSSWIVLGIVGFFLGRRRDKNSAKARQYEIEEKDERNIRLREKAGLAAWYSTILVLLILMIAFVFMDNLIASLLTGGALCIHATSIMVWTLMYNKKM